MLYKNSLGFIAICCILLCCSKKKDDPSPKPEPQPAPVEVKYGKVGFHLHFYVGNDEVTTLDFNAPVNGAGRRISFGFGKFYLSDFEFVMNNGSVHRLPDAVLLKTNSNPTYQVGVIPVGSYKSIKFKVGLNPEYDTSSASAILNDATMLFGSRANAGGHIFLNMQGKIDTTSDESGDESQMVPYTYKIGTQLRLTPVVNLPESKVTINETGVEYFHLVMDISKLFSGVGINQTSNLLVNSVSDNSNAIAAKIASNIPGSFRLEY